MSSIVLLFMVALQDGFVPVTAPINPNDVMPAPMLVGVAYAIVWVALLAYLWSIRSRLAAVEREMQTIGRRVGGGK